MSDVLVEVKNLKEYFPIKAGWFNTIPLKAVDDVSFSINQVKPSGEITLVLCSYR